MSKITDEAQAWLEIEDPEYEHKASLERAARRMLLLDKAYQMQCEAFRQMEDSAMMRRGGLAAMACACEATARHIMERASDYYRQAEGV